MENEDGTATKRIHQEEDFVNLKRFGYSLKRLQERYPSGAPAHIGAKAMGISEEEFEAAYKVAITLLRAKLCKGTNDDEE